MSGLRLVRLAKVLSSSFVLVLYLCLGLLSWSFVLVFYFGLLAWSFVLASVPLFSLALCLVPLFPSVFLAFLVVFVSVSLLSASVLTFF